MEKKRRQRFVVKSHIDKFTGLLRKDVFVDDKLFEWECDEENWKNLLNVIGDETAAKIEIMNHFLVSLKEFTGRNDLTMAHIFKGITTGWI